MNELALFAGAGGGLLGSRLLGWRTVGYVERDDYCQRVLAARIKDGLLYEAPIFGDIRSFLDQGYAGRYRGVVDVVTAGFPCQPFSCAGKRAGADDERNLWPATAECLRVVRPRFALLENVPGLLTSGYFGRVLGDLAELGYDAEWMVLGADDVGAPHRRKRLWIVAMDDTAGAGRETLGHLAPQPRGERGASGREPDRPGARGTGSAPVADAERQPQRAGLRADEPTGERGRRSGDGGGADVADAAGRGVEGMRAAGIEEPAVPAGPQVPRCDGDRSGIGWWDQDPADGVESWLGRVADGLGAGLDEPRAAELGIASRVAARVPHRVDRLRALGNGQVPLVAATAWLLLRERLMAPERAREAEEP